MSLPIGLGKSQGTGIWCEMSGVEMRLWPSVPGAGWLPTPLWPSKGLIGQNTYREDSLHNWGLSSYISPCLHCSATLGNTSHPSMAGSQIQARKSVRWLGGRGGEQAAFPFFPPETCPRRPAVWPGLTASEPASQGSHRTGWETAGERMGCWARGGK